MSKFVFITDLHATSTCPVRTGDPLKDCLAKVSWCVDLANENGATLLLGGDLFDRPCVPYDVSNSLCEVLLGAKIPVYAVRGNHDMLFRSMENDKKCAVRALSNAGVRFLDGQTVDFGDCVLTNQLPLKTRSVPQILMYHGFLNQPDGVFSVSMADLTVQSPTMVLLGHDHVEYESMQLNDHVKVVRPGSLFRNRRVSTSDRNPKAVFVIVESGTVYSQLIEVPARSASEIFQAKAVTAQSVETDDVDYASLIEQLKNTSSEELSFMDIVAKVATDDVYGYISNALDSCRMNAK